MIQFWLPGQLFRKDGSSTLPAAAFATPIANGGEAYDVRAMTPAAYFFATGCGMSYLIV